MIKNLPSALAFIFICLSIRAFIAFYAAEWPITRIFGAIIGIGFWLISIFNLRSTGFEAGGPIWWSSIRPVHGTIWLLYAWTGEAFWLKLDLLLGIFYWITLRPF